MTRDDLTNEQKTKLFALALFWQHEAVSTNRANRTRAEVAVDEIYAMSNLPPPKKRWVSSPLSALVDAGESVERRISFDLEMKLYFRTQEIAETYGFSVSELLVDRTTRLFLPDDALTVEEAERFSRMRRRPPVWSLHRIRELIDDRIHAVASMYRWPLTMEGGFMRGALDPLPLYIVDAFAAVLELPEVQPLTAYSVLARSAGFVLPLEERVWLCERPTVLKRDIDGNLHASDGPAIDWGGTMPFYMWHGERVKKKAVEPTEGLRAHDIIHEPHRATRDILLQRFGLDRFCRDVGRVVRQDETGTLWRAGSIFAVEVENGTPEPDGSLRRYFLRVPPTMQSAREAVAWTYGLTKRDYKVAVRT